MRRITTSFAATTRFMVDRPNWTEEEKRDGSHGVLPDLINLRILNRSFMVDPWNRFYQDNLTWLADEIKKEYPQIELFPADMSRFHFERRVRMNCFYCKNYGLNWKCPPK